MSAKDKREEEKKIINEVFNLDLYEFVDEYTDKGSGKASEQMPDCYLRSKKEGLPDLAIEVKTLERDLDRTADFEMPNIPEYSLSVRNFHVVLRLNLIPWKEVHPKKMLRLWENLGKELSKYKKEWEYGLNKASSKKAWLEEHIRNFLLNYFFAGKQVPSRCVNLENEGDELIFTVNPSICFIYWAREDLVFHMNKIEEYVEESRGKFNNLRKVKSDKSDDSPHWELLLVKGQTRIRESFKSFIEELDKELEKKGYDCLFYVREPGSWFGTYHLIVRMDLEAGTSVGDDWKTQIMRILTKA
jgi:hypothetical protein